jgi:hypothetical protein
MNDNQRSRRASLRVGYAIGNIDIHAQRVVGTGLSPALEGDRFECPLKSTFDVGGSSNV